MRAILTYHSIDPSGSAISVAEGQLRNHIKWFASREVQVVPLEWLHKVPDERDAIAITFDDGFQNFADVAWPLFKHNDLPVTLFVATERVGTNNDWSGKPVPGIPTLPLMKWEAIQKLVDHGLSLGSHSRTHARLERCDQAQLAREIEGSAAEIEQRTGVKPKSFCYPFGAFDERAVALAKRHYELAVTTELALLSPTPDAHRLPRLDVFYWRTGGLANFGRPAFRRKVALRALGRRLRGLLSRG